MKRFLKCCFVLALALAAGARSEVDVAGAPPGNIEGKVIVAASGRPLAGVKLRLQGTNDSREPVLSGADGSFRLTVVAPGRAVITAEFPLAPVGDWVAQNVLLPAGLDDVLFLERPPADWVAEDVPVTVASGETRKDVLVRALKGGVAVVRVLSTGESKPVANVPVKFSSQLSLSPIVAKTGADGVARVRLLPDTWQISHAEIERQIYSGQIAFSLFTGQTNQVELRMMATSKITGTVLGPGGAPAGGVAVSIEGYAILSQPVTTDANGHYELSWWQQRTRQTIAGGMWYLRAHSADGKMAVIREIANSTTNQDLTLEPTVTISAKVEDPLGRPVTNATALAEVQIGNRSAVGIGGDPRNADGQGHIEFTGVPKGAAFALIVSAKGYGEMTHVLPMPDPPTNRLEFPAFVLPLLNQQLGGQILDENGKPVAGVQLQARAISHVVRPTAGVPDAWDVATISGRYLGFSQTDRDGHFFFDEVCEGPIQLTLSVQGPAILLETTGGTTNILLRLDLTRVNRVIFGNNLPPPLDPVVNITGTVRDPSGAPAAGTTIEWAKHGELPSVNTDSTGRYSIPWLKGANTLSLLARDEQRNLAATNELNSTITNVDLRLNPGLTISVKAQDADGRPIPSATGTLAFKGEYSQWSLSRVPARADEQGRIEFRGLPQGLSYITSVTSRGYSTETAEAPLEATRTNRLELPPAVLRVPDTEPDAGK